MSLDLTKIASQVEGMVTRLKASGAEKQRSLSNALDVLHQKASEVDSLTRKIASSTTTWLVAGLLDGLDQHHEPSPLPTEFTVIATDGSHIDVDRHQSARCFLINIGSVVLHYGAQPDAMLDSFPRLYTGNEELVMMPPDGKGRQQAIEGNLLGIRRSVDECQQLAELAAELPADRSTLALMDGSLILWGLEAYPEFVTETLLDRGFLVHLEQIRKLNKKLVLASYISLPRSADVVNTLRVALCPNDPLDTDRHCPDCAKRECEAVSGVLDREIFFEVLAEGERSALFKSQSSVVERHYGAHQVYFFYLRVDDEIARVEIPQWVARDKSQLNLAHCLILDQCRRGQGYPVALAEAHEKAVVTMADRENFWQLVESLLVEEHLPTPSSGKSQSKRTRWI